MLRRVLDAVFLLGFAAAWPAWRRKKRGDWAARWGRGAALSAPPAGGRVLLHAVSVGEVNATRPLVTRLLADERFADVDLALSVTTDSGIARAAALYAAQRDAGRLHLVRYPLDYSPAVRRFMDRVRPSVVGLVELELWPNFLLEAGRRGMPVAVVNGRLSDRSFPRYRRAGALLRPFFQKLAAVGAQDRTYADRFAALGAPGVTVTGSLKWDGAADAVLDHAAELHAAAAHLAEELGVDRSKAIVVAGSTASGEARLIAEAVDAAAAALGREAGDVQLVCAPRRPEWFDDAASELSLPRRSPVRRSRPGSGDAASGRFLLDTIGELRAAYALADVAVVGRSFGALFGSDVMEPAALGTPVLIGPRFGDFVESVEALRAAGGLHVVQRGRLADELAGLLADDGERRTMGEAARACVLANRGAAERSVELIASLLGVGGARRETVRTRRGGATGAATGAGVSEQDGTGERSARDAQQEPTA
jgi:3-deoxy-D-manno-octulosonic-acid transferase